MSAVSAVDFPRDVSTTYRLMSPHTSPSVLAVHPLSLLAHTVEALEQAFSVPRVLPPFLRLSELRVHRRLMRQFVNTVLCGLAAAASVSFVNGQQFNATAGSKTVDTTSEAESVSNVDGLQSNAAAGDETVEPEERAVVVGFTWPSAPKYDSERNAYGDAVGTDRHVEGKDVHSSITRHNLV